MRDLYGDDYASVAGGADPQPLIPDNMRRIAGAAVFLGLIAALGLWSYRLGTRDATEVPIIRAMEGPARVEPADPGGLQAAHQGLEVNAVLAGRPAQAPQESPAAPAPAVLLSEDAPQGELVQSAPQALAERVLSQDPNRIVELTPAGELAAVETLPGALGDAEAATDLAAVEIEEAAAVPSPRPMNRPRNLVIARAKPAEAAPRPAAPATVVAAVATAPAAAPAARAAAPASSGASPAKGARLVQLGVFDSEAITRKAWDQLAARNPDLLGAKNLYVERTTANARVFYRLRVAGFQNTEQTRQMCEALRARGVDCIPVTLQ